tara:strand:+ start:136 stop:387 length:252 start_codon:yes stop_codon:yes gene_type:complete
MSNLARKIRRKKERENKKKLNRDVKRQLALFKHLPDTCSSCGRGFDKTSRDHHMTWRVQVYEEPQYVGLLCPDCQEPKRGDDA